MFDWQSTFCSYLQIIKTDNKTLKFEVLKINFYLNYFLNLWSWRQIFILFQGAIISSFTVHLHTEEKIVEIQLTLDNSLILYPWRRVGNPVCRKNNAESFGPRPIPRHTGSGAWRNPDNLLSGKTEQNPDSGETPEHYWQGSGWVLRNHGDASVRKGNSRTFPEMNLFGDLR